MNDKKRYREQRPQKVLKYKIVTVLLFLLLVLVNITVTVAQSSNLWVKSESSSYNLTFITPVTPTLNSRLTGDIPSDIYKAHDNGMLYSVTLSNFNRVKINIDSTQATPFYQQMKEGLVENPSIKIEKETFPEMGGHKAMELKYVLHEKGVPMLYYRRYLIIGNRLYQFTIGSILRNDDYLKKYRELFFNGITIKN